MVQGACSSAGKSLIATGLCRAFARRGLDVAPFKAQNMSNNARVAGGGEIGTAQYLQALAAGVEPHVRMNPVLVKPEGDNRSQVVVLGKPDLELSRLPWRSRSARLWPVIEGSLRRLLAEHEVLVIEGAGSPAETNLRDTDLANMRTAACAGARVLLVADIDRGGAFAHLYGTWALLPETERALLAGFVLNKFRGDPSLLRPAPQDLRRLTGVPTVGVIPWLDHGLPDEDGAADPTRSGRRSAVAVVRYPTASNLDEFKLLEQVADVRWATRPDDLEGSDLVILPGSKHVAEDLAWLRRTALADAVAARARDGGRVLGICGGLQMLGERIEDQAGVDGSADGLGLLPLRTSFRGDKLTQHADCVFAELPAPWASLSRQAFRGYQIRHGRTVTTGPALEAVHEGPGYTAGAVLAVYAHGMLEDPSVLRALFGQAPPRTLDRVFDELADAVEAHLDLPFLMREAGIA
jgi:adenosylcobyric acid synthase